jgi:hypothetical protein
MASGSSGTGSVSQSILRGRKLSEKKDLTNEITLWLESVLEDRIVRLSPWKLAVIGLGCARLASIAFAQTPAQPAASQVPHAAWLDHVNIYATVFGAVLTGLGTLFGLPVVILTFKKTRAEIRKLELEAAALERTGQTTVGDVEGGISFRIADSNNLSIQVLADPRFLGPLLLLLDFILAWILLTFASYFIDIVTGVLGLHGLGAAALLVIAFIVLVPIAKEARRVRSVLKPQARGDAKASNPEQTEGSASLHR